MNRVHVVSDTHFGHKKIIEFEPSRQHFKTIEEHDECLVDLWNDAVSPKDTVWHLGDVLFGLKAFDTMKKLNGVKKLVMGNHDRYPTHLYLDHFSSVHGTVKVRDLVLTHVPIHRSQSHRFALNLHGHLHSHVLPDPWYVNVSLERTGLRPILLDSVVHEALTKLSKYPNPQPLQSIA